MLTLLLILAAAGPAAARPCPANAPTAQTQGTAGQALPPRLINGSRRASVFAAQAKGTLWNSTHGGPQVVLLGRLDGNVYSLRLSGTGTGWDEDFLLGIPPDPLEPAPLLVLFHQYDVSENDTYYKTEFFKQAMLRGWYVVAPLGAHELNFGIDYSQRNTEVCLDWVTGFFGGAIDASRVYGVGYSMGAGGLLAYAARHTDSTGVRFAAALNHTGTLSVADLHASCPDTTILDHPLMFGPGGPAANELGYQRASVIHLWPQSDTVDLNSDFARNLHGTYIESWYAKFDSTCRLIYQNLLFQRYLNTPLYLHQGHTSNAVEFPTNQHTWGLLDEGQILDTFERITLQPNRGTTDVLADREARYHDISVFPTTPNTLSRFRFNSQPDENRIFIDRCENIARLEVHSNDAGLNTSRPLRLVLGPTPNAQAIEIAFTDFPHLPSNVQIGNQSTTSWTYDPTRKLLILQANNPAVYHTWTIVP
jgi:hypothetical protein